MTLRHPTGRFSFGVGKYEAAKLFDWVTPVVLTAGVAYGTTYVAALSDAGGWRAVLACVLVLVGRAGYQWAADNSAKQL